jgi:hypothetical protein
MVKNTQKEKIGRGGTRRNASAKPKYNQQTKTPNPMNTIAQQLNFNSVEKVLFKATVDFAMTYEKLTLSEAEERGIEKVMQKRSMAKNIKFKF